VKEVGLEAYANCSMSEVSFTIQHLFVGIALLIVKVKVLSLDALKLVMLCMEHVDISYNSRIPKMVEGIINNKAGGGAGVEDCMVSIFNTWTIEVRGGIGLCMKRSAIDGFVFALSSLMDDSIID